MRSRILIFLAFVALLPARLPGDFELLTGFEGPVREPRANTDQTWLGLQYTAARPLWWRLAPYARLMVDIRHAQDYLVSAGMAAEFRPFEGHPDLFISLQTGPAWTDVGRPHTGAKLNWSSDIRIGYKVFFAGYSHTSNGGTERPNSGLDLLLVGLRVSWD